MDQGLKYVIGGIIGFNFAMLALTAAVGLFETDVVFALMLLVLAATAALLLDSKR